MKSEFIIEFESAEEMKEFIAKINPVIKIAYSESQEIEEFRQKLLSLQSENDVLRFASATGSEHKFVGANTKDTQIHTFTPQEKYVKKAGKPSFMDQLKKCEFEGCDSEFKPYHNRVKFCPVHRSKKVKKPGKTAG